MRNLQQMMQQVKKMQEELQQQMESLRVEASSGGGMVTVRMNGAKRVLSVKIDPEALKNSDAEMLQDLRLAASPAGGIGVPRQGVEFLMGIHAEQDELGRQLRSDAKRYVVHRADARLSRILRDDGHLAVGQRLDDAAGAFEIHAHAHAKVLPFLGR